MLWEAGERLVPSRSKGLSAAPQHRGAAWALSLGLRVTGLGLGFRGKDGLGFSKVRFRAWGFGVTVMHLPLELFLPAPRVYTRGLGPRVKVESLGLGLRT